MKSEPIPSRGVPVLRAFLGGLIVTCAGARASGDEPTRLPCPVVIEGSAAEGFRVLRGGKPFEIRGVGGEERLDLLASCGGTTFRTWGIESCDRKVDGLPLLDAAEKLGLAATVGIWLEHERHGFDYEDPAQVARQRAKVEEAVTRHRHHPAVLFWGLGNEMEGPVSNGANPVIWREVNELARLVKRLDPHHPVMTVVANVNADKVRAIIEHAPDVDILGVNAYGGVAAVGRILHDNGWLKPYCITEFGLLGPWETPHTEWKAPIEPSSREKAGDTYSAHKAVMADRKQCLGTYAFLWGHKQEATWSWFGMLTPSGEKTPRVDAIVRAWTGKWPADRAPVLKEVDVPLANATLKPGQKVAVRVRYDDPEGRPLAHLFEVIGESTDRREGGDKERAPAAIAGTIHVAADDGRAEISAPRQEGNYRLFVTVKDGAGSAAVDNWCFRVER